jgi:5'-nucleotidase
VALNVNVPALPEDRIRGFAVARQGRARLMESFERRVDPREHEYYWLAGETQLAADEEPDSDASALRRGLITITPIDYDLTCHEGLDRLKDLVAKI